MYFLGAMLGSEEESHISGDLISSSIKSGKGKKIVAVITNFINVVISGYFTYLTALYCIKQTRLGATIAVLRYLFKKPESFVKSESTDDIGGGSQEDEE